MSNFFGIDLGTSNSAMAQVEKTGQPEIVPITQIISANGIGEKSLLPSALYLPAEGELPFDAQALPWKPNTDANWISGEFARERGALQPDRLVVSAKSWLSHPHESRSQAILPWGSESIEKKLCATKASQILLDHLLQNLKTNRPNSDFNPSQVVITVPASFDEIARGLTLDAAKAAGLGEATLLEEPQAAFYAWLENQGQDWRKQVREGNLILVCDIGGGTSDFSLIAVTSQEGELALERVAVGEHILLGGDNMDLALAMGISKKLSDAGTPLDDWQFLALVQNVRSAKESLLSNPTLPSVNLAIPSRGRRLIASTISAVLTRQDVDEIALDGFFPLVGPSDVASARRNGGLREAGLPYAAEPAITKHLARFLTRAHTNASASARIQAAIGDPARLSRSTLLLPDAVLFNGGVFNSPALCERILDQLQKWAGQPVRKLEGSQPDYAVALGAALYARLRATGKGLRIKSGTARSYYIGMESAAMAVPGRSPVTKALCVAPQGMEEGSHYEIKGREFFLYTGEISEFRFFHSEIRSGDNPGDLLPDASELIETSRLEVFIPPPPGHDPGQEVPVKIQTRVTELGNLELYFAHDPTGERWKLEFNVRME